MTTDHQQISVSAANYDLATPQLLQSAPFQLARQLIPVLSGLELGIGGSLLMLELGLLTKARDLDLVCSQQDFPLIAAALGRLLTQVEVPPHPEYQSAAFARFIAAEGTEVDLMAGIKVKQQQLCWQFAPGLVAAHFFAATATATATATNTALILQLFLSLLLWRFECADLCLNLPFCQFQLH